jgi:hypothetical protein
MAPPPKCVSDCKNRRMGKMSFLRVRVCVCVRVCGTKFFLSHCGAFGDRKIIWLRHQNVFLIARGDELENHFFFIPLWGVWRQENHMAPPPKCVFDCKSRRMGKTYFLRRACERVCTKFFHYGAFGGRKIIWLRHQNVCLIARTDEWEKCLFSGRVCVCVCVCVAPSFFLSHYGGFGDRKIIWLRHQNVFLIARGDELEKFLSQGACVCARACVSVHQVFPCLEKRN